MRVSLPIDFDQHYVDIPPNKLGKLRRLWVRRFSFDLLYKKFSLDVVIKHYYPRVEIIPAVYDNDELITTEQIITHDNEIGEYIGDMKSIVDVTDEFVGDQEIMVFFDPSNPTHERTGEILNPDRNAVQEDVPYISQYEFIYIAFLNPVAVWNMIKTLLENYQNYPE